MLTGKHSESVSSLNHLKSNITSKDRNNTVKSIRRGRGAAVRA